ncbi:glyoxalase [Vibrio sp. J383]|uniref:glyoxalase n=1 Tax=Vibrio sp. J383 TaxID=2942997 RepID=UPI0020BDCFC2|nr:glyoxalase [Vibrio sp. J383]UQV24780.1 glyoxalase [Vibrio sp. J383]UQV24963.1 glyoxalase [Vibrio sp. J383]
MSLQELKTALQEAKNAYTAKESEIKGHIDEKRTQESRLKTLGSQLHSKQTELRNALSQSSAETLTTELNALESQKQACETLINNISNYLKGQANNEKTQASERIESAEKALLLFVYKDIKSQLNILSDEQKELLKDFVVISTTLSSSLPGSPRPSYYLGSAFDALYGQLKGPEFRAHQAKMLAKYAL